MRRIALVIAFLVSGIAAALAQTTVSVIGAITPGDCAAFNSQTIVRDGGFPCNGGAGLTVGTSPISGGSSNGPLYNNGGVLGNLAPGTNNQALMGNTGAAPGFRPLVGADLPVGVDTNTLRSVTSGPDSIATTDCGKTVEEGTGSSGFWTVTLPAVAGFNSACQVTVVNGDTARGKILSGFPTTMTSPNILWPGQIVSLKIVNGVWVASNPGRWKNPSQITLHVDKTNGSNTNDGLAATTGAVADAQTAWNYAQYLFDLQGHTSIVAMACGQTYTVALNMGGAPTGNNLIQLSPDGNCSFTWTNAGPCINIGDLSELDLNLTFFGGSGSATFACNTTNAAFTGNILLHNDVVVDIEGTPVWNPAGSNDNFLFCDGMCQFTIANGITDGTATGANYFINMSAGGHGTQSGALAGTGVTLSGLYYLFGPALLNLGTSGTATGTVGNSKVYGHATLVNNGVTIPGGVSVGASGVNCTSLTSTC